MSANDQQARWFIIEVIVSGSKSYIGKHYGTEENVRASFPRAIIRPCGLVTITERP